MEARIYAHGKDALPIDPRFGVKVYDGAGFGYSVTRTIVSSYFCDSKVEQLVAQVDTISTSQLMEYFVDDIIATTQADFGRRSGFAFNCADCPTEVAAPRLQPLSIVDHVCCGYLQNMMGLGLDLR